ncbi:MAG: hypothetical protein CME88_08790 [Hirschia sp.]|nr:hypothetical protein [Hirschia sp.]
MACGRLIVLRLFIVIPIYAFVAIFLPQQDWFTPISDQLRKIDPDIAIIISVAGVLLAGAIYMGLRRFGQKWMMLHPRFAQILFSGCLGLFIAGIFDVFERLSGYATDVISLIIVPIAFMIADAIFLALDWRMNKTPD